MKKNTVSGGCNSRIIIEQIFPHIIYEDFTSKMQYQEKMLTLAIACTTVESVDRPTMQEVVNSMKLLCGE